MPYACGVTAYSREDALRIVAEAIFDGDRLPPIGNEIADVDLSELELGVSPRPPINPVPRGVWLPSRWPRHC